MKEIKWKRENPRHHLLLVSEDKGGIVLFKGKSIPGIAAVRLIGEKTVRLEDDNTEIEFEISPYLNLSKPPFISHTWILRIAAGVIDVDFDPYAYVTLENVYTQFLNTIRKNSRNWTAPGPGLAKFCIFMQREFPDMAEDVKKFSNNDLWELSKETNSLAKTQDELKRAFIRARG